MTASIMNDRVDRLQELLNDANAAERWRSFIENSSDDRLRNINAFEQAAQWRLDEYNDAQHQTAGAFGEFSALQDYAPKH